MDRAPDRPLTVEEAKNRLRRTTEEMLPSGYVRHHPYSVLILAFGIGFILGKTKRVKGLITRALLQAL